MSDEKIENLSAEEAQSAIKDVMSDPSHPYFDKYHPGHSQAKATMDALYGKAYPEPEGDLGVSDDQRGLADLLEKTGWDPDESRRQSEDYQADLQASREMKATETELRQSWGSSYQENVSYAQSAYDTIQERFGDEESEVLFEEFGNDVRVLRLMARIGKVLAEGK
jgi:hypothetical protein